MRKIIFASLILIIITACSQTRNENYESVTSRLFFDKTSITLHVGDTTALSSSLWETEHELVFSSSDESVVTVTPNGIIEALSEGSALITSSIGEMTASLMITVVEPNISIVLQKNTFSLGETVEFDIIKNHNDDDTYNISVSLLDNNDEPIIVSNNSFVAKAPGLYRIKVNSGDIVREFQVYVVDLNMFISDVFRLTNIERINNNLHPLEYDRNLEKAANIRAYEISEKFSHTRPDGSPFETAFSEANVEGSNRGENLARTQQTPTEVVKEWYESESHRKTMLNPVYLYMGVGIYIDNNGIFHWVQTFGG